MDQFKHVFNAPSLYETLFFTILTATEYDSLQNLKDNNENLYEHWLSFSKKMFEDSSEEIYLKKGHYVNEFSKIISIGYGIYHIKNDEANLFYRCLSGEEKQIVEKFFGIINEFSKKKLDGYLCGHNVNGHHIPMLCKAAMKYELSIPKTIKNNLIAKPWENTIIDTVDLWKFNGGNYISQELIARYLGINTEIIDFNETNINYHTNPDFSLLKVTKIRFNELIEIYNKMRVI